MSSVSSRNGSVHAGSVSSLQPEHELRLSWHARLPSVSLKQTRHRLTGTRDLISSIRRLHVAFFHSTVADIVSSHKRRPHSHSLGSCVLPAWPLHGGLGPTCFGAVSFLFISYDLRQTIITRIISKSTCPIFAKFSGLVELAVVQMIMFKLVFRSLKECCQGSQFMLVLSTKLIFSDMR